MENVVIIGTGPAGLTAAIYTGRAQLNPLLITGKDLGGQITLTSEIENYPGFPEGVAGFDLAQRFQQQAEKFGARIERNVVTGVDLKSYPFVLTTESGQIETRSIVVASGASPRRLGIPGEDRLISRGVSYCATCDGFFFRDKRIAVIGGGDSALDEGLFLTRFGREVVIIHRRDRLRANALLQKRAFNNDKIKFMWDSQILEIIGDQRVEKLKIQNVNNGSVSEEQFDGVFIFIGYIPNTAIFKNLLTLNEAGYLVVDHRGRTNIEGVFAAGDVHDYVYRQAITAAGSGAVAGIEVEKFLAEKEGKGYPTRTP